MPDKETIKRAQRDKREGKSPSTQAGEFVREEIHHVREGKHGATSTKQAIAIGLSKARRAGVRIPAKGKSAKAKRGGTRRRRGDRRTRGRLRELCDEVLASYRAAQGEDLVTNEDRQVAEQVLRDLAPRVAR